MSHETIEVGYVWTLDEFLTCSEAAYRRKGGAILRYGRAAFAILVGGLGVCLFLIPVAAYGPGFFCLMSSISLFWVWSPKGYYRWAWKRQFLKAGIRAQPDHKVTIVMDEERVRIHSAGTDLSQVWGMFTSVAETPGGFLLYQGKAARWIPNHAFARDGDRERFVNLSRRVSMYEPFGR